MLTWVERWIHLLLLTGDSESEGAIIRLNVILPSTAVTFHNNAIPFGILQFVSMMPRIYPGKNESGINVRNWLFVRLFIVMSTIALVDRVKLNYAIGTIVSIVVYTFSISSFATYFNKLWPHILFFILSELAKLVVLQKMYALDPTYTQDGVRRQRGDNFSESIKFAILMILTVFSFAFICIVMGGESSTGRLFIQVFQSISYSSCARELRADIHIISIPHRPYFIPDIDFHRRVSDGDSSDD